MDWIGCKLNVFNDDGVYRRDKLSTYLVGYLEHVDLRAEVEKAQGEEFKVREYHDRLLSFGSPPVQFVRALLLDLPIPE